MKKRITILMSLFLIALALLPQVAKAQAPEKMSYQTVIRDSASVLITSTTVGIQISILQGAASGAAVFVETHTPTTNANGLANLEIGTGTPVTGTMAGIDWSAGPYFIKTETDPLGGTAYSIVGTSQLMSVPYALFSANGTPGPVGPTGANGVDGINGADGATGAAGVDGLTGATGANGVDGINGADGAAGAAGVDGLTGATGADGVDGINGAIGATGAAGTNGNNGLDGATGLTGATGAAGTNGNNGLDGATGLTGATGAAGTNGSNGATGLTGATGATGAAGSNGSNGATGLTGATGAAGSNGATGATGATGLTGATGAAGSNGLAGATGATGGYSVHTIGESYGGGIVFYVYDGGQHGLIAATADQSTGIRWDGGSNTNTCARGDGIGAGIKNTAIIIANQGPVDGNTFAARICNEYSVTVGGTTYGDWYLPSKYELNLLYLQKTVVGGFTNNYYWSSTEFDANNTWRQKVGSGLQVSSNKNNASYVRAVRTF